MNVGDKNGGAKNGTGRSTPVPLPPGADSNDTAGEWARRRGRQWVARRVDVVRGLTKRMDFTDLMIRLLLTALVVYSIYLAWCESCKSEYQKMAAALWRAIVDFVSFSRGQSAAAVVLALIVWLTTVLLMRMSSPVYLIDFKTYRHKGQPGGKGEAGVPATHERFLDESKLARRPDNKPCFTQQSMEFQEKLIRTSCISGCSIFPDTIFAGEKAGHWGKVCRSGARTLTRHIGNRSTCH